MKTIIPSSPIPLPRIGYGPLTLLAFIFVGFAVFITDPAAHGATIIHSNDTVDPLNASAGWTGGVVPAAGDTAAWTGASSGGTFLLGGNLTWHGIQLTSPSGAVTINPDGNTLTLGTGGIDMSAATQGLTIGANLTIRAGSQTWNVAGGQTLALASSGTFTRTLGGAVLVIGSGTVNAAMTGLSNASLVNGIIGPWATVNTGGAAANNATGGYTYATINGTAIVPYTGATPLTAGFNWPSGNASTFNYDVSAGNGTVPIGTPRTANTVRYTGARTTEFYGSNNTMLLTLNGLMNAGSGTLTFAENDPSSNPTTSFGQLVIGTNNELVLTAESAPFLLNFPIVNGAASGGVTTAGPSSVTVGGSNTYTGPTLISSGTTILTGTIGFGATGGSAITNRAVFNEPSGGSITGTSSLTNIEGTVTLNGVNSYTGATVVSGGTLASGGAGSINGTSGINIAGSTAAFFQNSTTALTSPITLTTGMLAGSGTASSVTVVSGSGGVISNGNGTSGNSLTLTIGSLTFGGAGVLSLNFPAGSPAIVVTGVLTTTGTAGEVVIGGSGSFVNGLNNLISFGSFSGSLADFMVGTISGLNSRQTLGPLQLNGNNIAFNVTGDSPVFTGSNGGIWTVGTSGTVSGSPTFALKSNGAPTDFLTNDTVEFNDSVNLNGTFITPLTTTATLIANVNPNLITFNNNKLAFTITSLNGSGIVAGAITMNGTNSVILTTTNSYAGATNVNAGTLKLSSGGVLSGTPITIGTASTLVEDGSSSIIGASSLGVNGIANLSGSNSYSGATTVTSGSLRITGSGSLANTVVNVGSPGSLLEGGTASILGTAAITSNGTVTLNGSNSYTGATTETSGTFSLASGGSIRTTAISVGTGAVFNEDAFSSINGTASLNSSGVITLNGSNSYTGTTTVTAGTLNYNGSLASGGLVRVGVVGGANALLNIGSNASINVSNVNVLVGNGITNSTGQGFVYQAGGTVSGINQLQIGGGASGSSFGYYNLASGTLGMTELDLGSFNGAAVGVLDMSGGTLNISNWLVPARGNAGTGILNMTGGTLNFNGPATQIQSNWGGAGLTVINIANATLNAPSANINLMSTGAVGALSEINLLPGGLLQANGIAPGSATGTTLLNFNGGTLVANAANATFLTTNLTAATVYSGGGTIDNNGVSITIPIALAAPAGSGANSKPVINNGGSGYLGAPAVSVTGAGGAGAAAYAVLSGGVVTGIVVTNPGTGYTGPLSFTLTGGGGSGASIASVTPTANTSGGLTFQGVGTTTLSGNNTYTGPTVVNAGTLILSSSFTSSSAVSIAAGATLRNPGFLSTSGVLTSSGVLDMTDSVAENLTVGGISFNTATLNFDILNNSTDQITASGAATISGNNVINLILPAGQTVTTGTYVLLTASGGGLGSGFSFGPLPTNTFSFSLANSTSTQEILVISGNPIPAIAYWTGIASASGTNPSNQWGFGVTNSLGKSNWSTTPDGLTNPQQVPGSTTDVIMTASNAVGVSGTLNTQLDSQYAIKSLTYNVPASTGITNAVIDTNGNILVIGSGGVALAATSAATGEIIDSTGTGSIILSASQTWANNSNTQGLVIDENIASNVSGTTTFTLSGTGSGGVVLGGLIGNGASSGLSLVLNQAGITEINGPNTYSGGTTFTSGTIQLGNTSALGTGPITFSAGSTADIQLNGLGQGGGSLQVGDLNTNAGNPGNVIIESGATPNVIDNLSVSISANDVFAGTLRDGIAGVLSLSTAGSGTLKLTGTNTYSGGTIILGNTVQINSTANIGSTVLPDTIKLQTGTLETTGTGFDLGSNKSIEPSNGGTSTLQVDSGTLTVSGSIYDSQDSGDLLKTGTGNLIVSGADSHSGSWFVRTGNLFLTNTNNSFGGVILTSTGTIVNVASLSDYGANSAIGNRTADTASATDSVTNGVGIHITGGTLQYTGSTAQSTNRQIRIGLGTATIDASGSVPGATVAFTYSGTNTNLVDGAGARTLNLTGNNTSNNIFGIGLTDQAAGTGLTSILKSGPGTWELTGSNTNTGATTITGGILRMDANNTLGSSANIGSISAGATLDLNDKSQAIGFFSGASAGQITNQGVGTAILSVTGTAPGTFAGNLVDNTGKVGLTLNSAGGTLTLTGSVAISGPVTITSGTLALPNGPATVGAVTVGGPSALLRVRENSGATQPMLTTLGLSLGQSGTSTLLINFNNLASPAASVINTGTGSLTIAGPSFIALQNAINLTAGSTVTLIDYSGALVGSFSSLSLSPGTTTGLRTSFLLVSDTSNTSIDLVVNSDGPVWTGATLSGSSTHDWDIDTVGNGSVGTPNWQTLTTAVATTYRQFASGTDAVIFNDLAASSATNVNIVTQVSPFSVAVTSNTNNYTFSGQGGIAGATGLLKTGASTLTITTSNSYTGATTISSGTLQIGDGITDGSITSTSSIADNASLVYDRLGSFSYSGAISGTGSLTMMGTGTQTLSGANTFTGKVNINGGSLAAGSATAFNASNAVTFGPSSNGAFRTGNNAVTIGDLNGDGTAFIINSSTGNGSLTVTATGTDTFNGTISNGSTGTLGLTKAGAGSLTLGGANSNTGATLISAGTLILAHTSAINGSTLTVGPAGALSETVDNAITGGGSLIVQNSITLSHANSYTGPTILNSGTGVTLTVTNANGAGNGGEFNAQTGATTPVIRLHIDGGGTINMPNSFGGNSLISTTINVDNNGGGGSNGVIALTATNSNWGGGDTLNVTGGDGYSLSIAGITDTSGVTSATSTFNPTSANLTIGFLANASALAGNSFTLSGTSTGNSVTGAIINGPNPVSLFKTNSSSWTLSGVSTYTGTTSITGGGLIVTGAISGSTAVSVTSGATLNDNGTINTAVTINDNGGRVSGQGTLGSLVVTGGTLAPGFSADNSTAGTLTATGNVTLDSASTFNIRLGVAGPADGDRLSAGSVSLNRAALSLTIGPSYVQQAVGFVYVLINGGAGSTGIGGNVFAQGSTITASNGNIFNILYGVTNTGALGGADVDLVGVAVPEPATWTLLFAGLAIAGLRRRISHRRS